MVLTPLCLAALRFVRSRQQPSAEGYERPEGLKGAALIVGFGRVGQIASQFLLARNYDISIIDTDVEMIDTARTFDFKIYCGDGTRLDILHAAGAGRAQVISGLYQPARRSLANRASVEGGVSVRHGDRSRVRVITNATPDRSAPSAAEQYRQGR